MRFAGPRSRLFEISEIPTREQAKMTKLLAKLIYPIALEIINMYLKDTEEERLKNASAIAISGKDHDQSTDCFPNGSQIKNTKPVMPISS